MGRCGFGVGPAAGQDKHSRREIGGVVGVRREDGRGAGVEEEGPRGKIEAKWESSR